MPNSAPTYIRLLNLLGAIRELAPFNTLSADEELMLDDLIVRWHRDKAVRMSDMLKTDTQSSRTTTHRRLVALRDKGVIILDDDPQDKRAKFIIPGPKAETYLKLFREGVDQLIGAELGK